MGKKSSSVYEITETNFCECTVHWKKKGHYSDYVAIDGFVYEETVRRPGTLGDQVCCGMKGAGPTLYFNHDGEKSLSVIIEREIKKMIRSFKNY